MKDILLTGIIKYCETTKKDQLDDPWQFGMNQEMTEGYARAMDDVIDYLEKLKDSKPTE